MATRPIILDPFQRIVNVGWGSKKFAVLLINSIWDGTSHKSDSPSVSIQPLNQFFGLFDQINFKDDADRQVVLSKAPFTEEESSGTGPSHVSTTYFSYEVSYQHGEDSGFGQGWLRVRTFTSDEGTTEDWVNVTDPPEYAPIGAGEIGGLAAAQASFLEHGWDTFSTTGSDGPYEGDAPGNLHVFQRDNACIMFDLGRIRALCPPGTTHLQFNLSFGGGPGVIDPDNIGAIGYTWNANMRTYRNAAFNLFPVDAENIPLIGWPVVEDSSSVGSEPVQPVPAKSFHFVVALASLEVTNNA